ncbi:hypothetical protein M514_16924, partial [Trichuris suis]
CVLLLPLSCIPLPVFLVYPFLVDPSLLITLR